ncbi:MAG TPA: hypothetical protein VGD09_01825 [Blastococcus sp.]
MSQSSNKWHDDGWHKDDDDKGWHKWHDDGWHKWHDDKGWHKWHK